MLAHIYDIESVPNVFMLANYKPEQNTVDIYLLDDDQLSGYPWDTKFTDRLTDAVHAANKETFADGKVNLIMLNTAPGVTHLMKNFGCEFYLSKQIHTQDPYDPTKVGLQTYRVSSSDLSVFDDYKEGSDFYTLTQNHLTRDTDPDYDKTKHPYLLSYNGYNYDMTMLAWYFSRIVDFDYVLRDDIYRFELALKNISARTLRNFDDTLFRKDIKKNMPAALRAEVNADGSITKQNLTDIDFTGWDNTANVIRKNMILSGRYIDVARLNEKQDKQALKYLLGVLGYQILESENLNDEIQSQEELLDLIAYNVSDVIGTYNLMKNRVYTSAFEIKSGMLQTYPELIYKTEPREINGKTKNVPQISPDMVRKRGAFSRLYPDSTSQQLSARALSPDGYLDDNEFVSFMYPAESKATNIQPRDVLEESKTFMATHVATTDGSPEDKEYALATLNQVFDAYAQIRGSNYNESARYKKYYPKNNVDSTPTELPLCVPYFDAHCKPTSCYASFSIGGIHGAEYNKARYEYDYAEYITLRSDMLFAQQRFGQDPKACRTSVKRLADPIDLEFPSGRTYYVKDLLSPTTIKNAGWKKLPEEPQLFRKKASRGTELNKRYTYTTFCLANHEDFSSYYPGMLRQMDVFHNDTIEDDRYGDIYDKKQSLGAIEKDKSLSKEVLADAHQQRGGVKLILNTASGAGDAQFDNPIRMNNNITAMRCIGQMFTWRIAQAQAFEGALIPSTNTDGLYTVMEKDLNNRILAREATNIGIDIEPMTTWLISKDSNNRIEWTENADGTYTVNEASGGVAAYFGPSPDKKLAHPAILDWAIVEYLIRKCHEKNPDGLKEGTVLNTEALSDPFDLDLGRQILEEARVANNRASAEKQLIMFQHIVTASVANESYPFLIDKDNNTKTIQKNNRIFYVNADKTSQPTFKIRKASAKKLPDARFKARRTKEPETSALHHNPTARRILKENGVTMDDLILSQREAVVEAIPGIDTNLDIIVENHAIIGMAETKMHELLKALDINAYLARLCADYENNWRNWTPNAAPATKF